MNLRPYRRLANRYRPIGQTTLTMREQHAGRARWVYTFRNAAGEAIYVGCTADPYERFMAHSRVAPWWSEVAFFDLLRTPNLAAGLETELAAIHELRPRYNTVGIPEREAAARARAEATRRARREGRLFAPEAVAS